MQENKITGSYYTPEKLVQAMIKYINSNLNKNLKILEPSGGDGRIVEELLAAGYKNIDIVEYVKEKTDKLDLKFKNNKCINIYNKDFTEFSLYTDNRYDLIIGNPPYINKKYIVENQKKYIKKSYIKNKFRYSDFNNIWNVFLLNSINLLNKNGSIFFVLPIEFLQSLHSESLRELVLSKFKSIEIFLFKEKVFDNISQSICLVYLSDKDAKLESISYKLIKDYNLKEPIFKNNIDKNNLNKKWTSFILDESEFKFITELSNKYMRVDSLGKCAPGVVTGANDYFILSNEFVKNNNLQKYVKPIISKAKQLKNILILDEEMFENTSKESNCNLLYLNEFNIEQFNDNIKKYIKYGEKREINKRYKCSKRNRWYDMPNNNPGDIVFFKRYDNLPKIIVNSKRCLTTDLGYNIILDKKFDAKSVVFCFFNSLTLALCEIKGRYYGGGVQELTPREFKELALPYKKIHYKQIEKFNKMVIENKNFQEIIDYVDGIVLSENIAYEDIRKIKEIRHKYLKRRKG
ncbi:Eco57I restriction-modification methylase domain-containing protein [Clostridium perfringens]|uniref:site-specific DNA-methyltransferase (adenine-specific) n=1 Tax=Clostridium perfringens TaxID=1502 RepID=A0AAN5SEI0_CLOPF|nr:Eco57I restriction-modification methylase domain-containing protein [Clostridium perfringens]MDO6335460.1 Eco57I restriction-modification methylase domain-containing protein [Clostridium perfringens]HAT4297963.1 N-6 DNA methylase [Clostridium perfringens]